MQLGHSLPLTPSLLASATGSLTDLTPVSSQASKKHTPRPTEVHRLDGTYQRQTTHVILKAATQAEEDYCSTQQIARDAVVGQAFYTMVDAVTSPAHATALLSQAETTLTKYAGDKVSPTNP